MAKFILQFNGITIKEIFIDKETMAIGREEDNDIVIDNLAVSGHHARLIQEKGKFFLEDLDGARGTFINGEKIAKHALNEGDCVLIGKHTLVFQTKEKVKVKVVRPNTIGETCIPDAEKSQDFFAKNLEQKTEEEKEKEEKLKGIISYILDDGEIKEVILEKKVTIIGKGEDVDIKIEGFFVGKNALLINKESGAFYVSRGDGKSSPKLNGKKIKGHIRLRDDDFIEVGSHKLRFSIKNS